MIYSGFRNADSKSALYSGPLLFFQGLVTSFCPSSFPYHASYMPQGYDYCTEPRLVQGIPTANPIL